MEEKKKTITRTTTTDPDRRVSHETTRETETRKTIHRENSRDDSDKPRRIEEITEIEEEDD